MTKIYCKKFSKLYFFKKISVSTPSFSWSLITINIFCHHRDLHKPGLMELHTLRYLTISFIQLNIFNVYSCNQTYNFYTFCQVIFYHMYPCFINSSAIWFYFYAILKTMNLNICIQISSSALLLLLLVIYIRVGVGQYCVLVTANILSRGPGNFGFPFKIYEGSDYFISTQHQTTL